MTALSRLEKYPIAVLGLFSVVLLFFNLGELPVSIMEARNFLVAREMITDGHWWLTTMNELPRYEKPPLPAWLTTPFVQWLGTDSVVAYRLPTSLISTFCVFSLYFLVKRLSNDRAVALYSALVLATSFYFLVIRFEAPSDMYTHAFMVAALYFGVRVGEGARRHLFVWLGGLCFGLSVLSKGPVSPYVLFLPFVFAYAVTFPQTLAKRWKSFAALLLIGLAVGASWYLYVRYADPAGMGAVADKETSNWTSYNVRPFYYYWSFFIQSGIWTIPAAVSLAFPYFRHKVDHPRLYRFSWFWTVFAVVLLSIIPEKKSRYLMPVLIPLAINVAQVMSYLMGSATQTRFDHIWARVHHGIVGLICLATPAVYFFVHRDEPGFWMWYVSLVVSTYVLVVILGRGLWRGEWRAMLWANFCLIVAVATIGMAGLPYLKSNENYRPLSADYGASQTGRVYSFGNLDPEIIWEWGASIPVAEASEPLVAPGDTVRVVVSDPNRDNFEAAMAERRELSILDVAVFDRNYFASRGKSGYKNRHRVHVYRIASSRP